jgi:hypothetical protein
MTNWNTPRSRIGAVVAAGALAGIVAGPATAQAEPQGYDQGNAGVALVYGTFNPPGEINQTLLVGGDLEGFCEAGPAGPGPGEAPARFFQRKDGTLDVKINDKDQPIYLYEQTAGDAIAEWLPEVCGAYFGGAALPPAVAEGTADLKVRDSVISDDLVEVFNSVNGYLTATDDSGAEYRVRGSADLTLVPLLDANGDPILDPNGDLILVPAGDPAEFVSFDLMEIRR